MSIAATRRARPLPLAQTTELVRRRVEVRHVGTVEITAHDDGLCEVVFCALGDHSRLRARTHRGRHPILDRTERYLVAYGEAHVGHGSKRRLPAQPELDLAGVSDFTRDVLLAACSIPFGSALTYGGVATLLGKPGAARAVGQALGRNPIPILIPCHRVLAFQGVGGFTSGLPIKHVLMALEGITVSR